MPAGDETGFAVAAGENVRREVSMGGLRSGTAALEGLVRGDAWMMRVLATVRDAGIADSWVGAGVLRDLVWGELYGDGFRPDGVRDVDVVFFDAADLRRENDERVTRRLRERWPGVP